jgi:hypothetical protein
MEKLWLRIVLDDRLIFLIGHRIEAMIGKVNGSRPRRQQEPLRYRHIACCNATRLVQTRSPS